jgi:LMBR1 domain-containing protein 1
MNGLWGAIFWMIPIWVFVMIPFMTFYYEADDGMLMAGTSVNLAPKKKSRVFSALCYELVVVAFAVAFFGISYKVFATTTIPVMEYTSPSLSSLASGGPALNAIPPISRPGTNNTFRPSDLINLNTNEFTAQIVHAAQELHLRVGASTFFGGLMAWIGWFLFAIFGGIGLAALPLDLILAYRYRPRHLDASEYAECQTSLRARVNELVEIGELIKIEREERAQAGLVGGAWSLDGEKRRAYKEEQAAVIQFKQAVYLLEEDVEAFQDCTDNYENANPLTPYIALVLGSCSLIVSFFWCLHIIIYVFPSPPIAPFLNAYFKWYDKWFPLFGVLSVAVFTSYLLFAALKGCFKFGIRFLFFQVHPMKVGKTYMSSFLFNIALVLLCALPVVQFCQAAFADYAAFSNIRQMFGVQVQGLKFFGWFWRSKIFVYIFLIMFLLTSIYLWGKPRDQSMNAQELRDRLRERTSGGPVSVKARDSDKVDNGVLT